MHNMLKGLLTFAVLFLAVIVAWGLVVTAPEPDQEIARESATTIRVMDIEKQRIQLQVRSQGNVIPDVESELIPEVSGRVQWISPKLVAGGYFHKGDALLRIDDRDYQSTLVRNQASVERAEAEYEHASFELERLEKLAGDQLISQAALESAIRTEKTSRAALRDARASLDQARRDLSRTEILAPYDGLVISEQVDQGQFVTRGQSIASIYASDSVEILLPVADQQLAWLDLPLGQRGELPESRRPEVVLYTNYGGQHYEWRGKLTRTEAGVDSRSRMVHAIVRVENGADSDGPPLPIGLFVNAIIEGRQVDNVVSLPRAALRNRNQVLVVSNDNRLHYRSVDVLRFDKENVLIESGLEAGETVNVSPLQTVVDGMRVNPVREQEET